MSSFKPGLVDKGTHTTQFQKVLGQIPANAVISTRGGRFEEQLSRIKEQARQEGFAEGYDSGFNLGRTEGKRSGYEDGFVMGTNETTEMRTVEFAMLADELATLRDQFQTAVKEWFAQSEQKLGDLAIVAVEKLLQTELQTSRESVTNIVKDALAEVTHAYHARLKVNVMDLVYLLDHKDEIVAASRSIRDVEIVADPSVSAGVIIETEAGLIDASLDTKLQLFENEFFGSEGASDQSEAA